MTPSVQIEAGQLEAAAPRQAVQEAVEMQRAISGGEVDAFVVGDSDEHKHVMMLSEAHVRYKQLVEDMQQGAVTVTGAGEILFANHSFAAMLGAQLIHLFNSSLESHVLPADRARFARLLSPRPGEPDIEIALARTDGETVAVHLSVVSASDDFVTLLITDLSERRVVEEANAIVAAIDQGQVDAFVVDGKEVVMLEKAHVPDRLVLERQRHRAADARSRAFLGTLAEEFHDILGPMRKAIVALKRKPPADADDRRALELLERQGAMLLGLVEDLSRINPRE
jgi:PAS domain S-box-containing protein